MVTKATPWGVLLCPWLVLPHLVLGQATVRGIVLADTSGTAVIGAVVEIPTLHLSTTTDNQGLFLLQGVPIGKHSVLARAVGYYPRSLAILIARADTLRLVVRLRPAPVTLDPITVEEQAVEALNPLMAGFADRRRNGLGEFLGPDELAKLASTSFPEVLRQFGLTIGQNVRGRPYAVGRRGGTCPVQVYVDDVLQPNRPMPFDLSSVRVETLAGVEYYVGAARVPIKYERGESICGVLVLWTRLRRP